MVRNLYPSSFRAPWPFVKKGQGGLRKIGPVVIEAHKWPGQNKQFPELSPKFQKNNHIKLRDYTGVRPTSYTDPETKELMFIPEMVPELIVPDLSGFKLKPYVSYKTDVEIQDRLENMAKQSITDSEVTSYDPKITLKKKWPSPEITPRLLFDYFYADKVRDEFMKKIKDIHKK